MAAKTLTVASLIFASALLVAATPDARAGEAADIARKALETGRLDDGEARLGERLKTNAGDDEARIGLGMVQFSRAVETFVQTQYRYGVTFRTPMRPLGLQIDPIPVNPKAEPPTYEGQRATLQKFLDDLRTAETTLAQIGGSPAKVTLDLNAIKIDLTGSDAKTTLGALLATYVGSGGDDAAAKAETFEATFDRADALWLRGYTHLISAGLEFALAYDWSDSFDRYAYLLYPNAVSTHRPKSLRDARREPTFMAEEETILDVVGFLHSIRWRCVEPERMHRAREHLKGLVDTNRKMWPIALARSDSDKHWIPGPQQANAAMPSLKPTREQVTAWLAAVDTFDALLDGKILAPFWRFDLGIDIRMFFEEPRDFDFIYWVTGADSVPYLKKGPTLTGGQWSDMNRPFKGEFLTYLIWLN